MIGPVTDDAPLQVRTEPFGGGTLVRAALAGEAPAASWYPEQPTTREGWRTRIEVVRAQFSAGAWLELLAPAFGVESAAFHEAGRDGQALDAATRALARVAGGAGVVVTTGQQPGLFGGPLYTLAKALSAQALAEELTKATGIPVAAIFWAATDDADWEEGRSAHVVGPEGLEALRLTTAPPAGTPASRAALGPEVTDLRRRLAAACGSAAFAPALAAVERAYVAGQTSGDAYVQLLRAVLSPLGIAVFDASHPAARAAEFQLLRRALLKSAEIERAVAERSAAMSEAGYTPQVRDVPGLSLVFGEEADGRKRRLRTDEARALVPRVAPGALSPNVLLRPIVERGILPTVAYAAGPGEYAYFAQVSAVAAALAVPEPLAVPRWSGTVVEATTVRALASLGLVPDALRNPATAERAVAQRVGPDTLAPAFEAFRAAVDAHIAALGEITDAGEPLLPDRVRDGGTGPAPAQARALGAPRARGREASPRRGAPNPRDRASCAPPARQAPRARAQLPAAPRALWRGADRRNAHRSHCTRQRAGAWSARRG